MAFSMAISIEWLARFMDRFFIASLCACFAYLPSHEAQHGNYSRGNPKLRWLDGLVGHITLITLKFPYHILRITHMKHHAYTNDPEKDPDYANAHNTSVLEVIKNVLDGSTVQFDKYLEIFQNDKAFVEFISSSNSDYSVLQSSAIWF